MALPDCTEEELQALYEWVDSVPLSRPKKSIARDFADGVLMAEMVHHYFPKLVELHNYSAAHNTMQKMYNWNTLNTKVFKRMGFTVARDQLEAVAKADTGCVERLLKHVRTRMARFQESSAAAGRTSRQGSMAAGMHGTADGMHDGMHGAGGFNSEIGGGMDGTGRFNGTGLDASLDAAGGWHAAPGAPTASTSRPASPHAAAAAVDSIAALRLGGAAAFAAAPAAGLPTKLSAGALLGGSFSGPMAGGAGAGAPRASSLAFPTLDQAVAANLSDKEAQLDELRETNEILEVKISKLEQLVRLKDAKISALLAKLQQATIEQQEQQEQAAAGQ